MKTFLITISTSIIFCVLFYACKPREVKPKPTENKIQSFYLNNIYVKEKYFDSTNNKFEFLIDTLGTSLSPNDFIKFTIESTSGKFVDSILVKDAEKENFLTIKSKNTLDLNYSIKFHVIKIIGETNFNFSNYSSDGINIEVNKQLTLHSFQRNTDEDSYKTYYEPIFTNQYANLEDNLHIQIRLIDKESFAVDNIRINYDGYNTQLFLPLKNIQRDKSNIIGNHQITVENFKTIAYINMGYLNDTIANLNITEYNPILQTITGTIEYQGDVNYNSPTTNGVKVHSKYILENFPIKNTQY